MQQYILHVINMKLKIIQHIHCNYKRYQQCSLRGLQYKKFWWAEVVMFYHKIWPCFPPNRKSCIKPCQVLHSYCYSRSSAYASRTQHYYILANLNLCFCRILTQFAGHVNRAMHDVIFQLFIPMVQLKIETFSFTTNTLPIFDLQSVFALDYQLRTCSLVSACSAACLI